MKRIPRFFLVVGVVLAINVPAVAAASDTCEGINAELSKYGWHEDVCVVPDPWDNL